MYSVIPKCVCSAVSLTTRCLTLFFLITVATLHAPIFVLYLLVLRWSKNNCSDKLNSNSTTPITSSNRPTGDTIKTNGQNATRICDRLKCCIGQLLESQLERLVRVYFHVFILSLGLAFNVNVFVKGKLPQKLNNNLIISNHATTLDWLFLFAIFNTSPSLNNKVRIVMKDSLRKMPIMGPYLFFMKSCFLARNLSKDEERIAKFSKFISTSSQKSDLIFFPEGTILTENTRLRSDKFAHDNDLPKLDHVLYPRVKGLAMFLDTFSENNIFNSMNVIDTTIMYLGDKMVHEHEILVKKNFDVFIDLEHYGMPEIFTKCSENQDKLKTKLFLLWQQKELKLNDFYKNSNLRKRGYKRIRLLNCSVVLYTLFFIVLFVSHFTLFWYRLSLFVWYVIYQVGVLLVYYKHISPINDVV